MKDENDIMELNESFTKLDITERKKIQKFTPEK